KTGEVKLAVDVNEGVPWQVAEVRVEGFEGSKVETVPVRHFVGQPWTDQLQQDAATEIRRAFYAQGYPDVRVRLRREAGAEREGRKDVVISARVTTGYQVKVGAVRFENVGDTKEAVLRRRVRTQPGDKIFRPLKTETRSSAETSRS